MIKLEDGLNLFICADPGARAHTLASWLMNELNAVTFEPGRKFKTRFIKAHSDFGNHLVKKHNGPKIRIRPGFKKLSVHMYLFLVKNVYIQIPNFSKNQFDLETATKMTKEANHWFDHHQEINENCYNYTINFEDTYDIQLLTDLYREIHAKLPSKKSIDILEQTNKLNDPILDKNHACSVASMVLERENQFNLKERDRFWSLPVLYQITPVDQIYDTILSCISPSNYGTNLEK